MGTMVLSHVNHFSRLLYALESGLQDRFWASYESHDRAVCRLARIHVQDFHSFNGAYRLDYLVDNSFVTPFAEIGHTLYNSSHYGYWFYMINVISIIVQCATIAATRPPMVWEMIALPVSSR